MTWTDVGGLLLCIAGVLIALDLRRVILRLEALERDCKIKK